MSLAISARTKRGIRSSRLLALLLAEQTQRSHFACRFEYRFHPERRWRFDVAWPDALVAVEIQGGSRLGTLGRHTSPQGFADDCEKFSHAAALGWRVLPVTPSMVRLGQAAPLALAALALSSAPPPVHPYGLDVIASP